MTEAEYIINTFKESFKDFKDKKIAIYGLGKNTEIIINHYPKFNIVCLLDGYRTDGMLYKVPIYSLEQAVSKGIECIIIIARANSAKIILKRIESVCRDASVSIYDIHGQNMLENNSAFRADDPYFNVGYEHLKKEIEKYDAVSFDIFDTLVTRKTLYPEDIFELVEAKSGIEGFAKIRIQAEREVNREKAATLKEIYTEVRKMLSLSEEQERELKETEIAIEQESIFPRADMVSLYQYAKDQGKEVSLISDMYLDKHSIELLLTKCKISGYDHLYISCEKGKTKTTGLFELYKTEVNSNSYLHIGDDADSDKDFAKMNGITSFRILKPRDMAEKSSYRDFLDIPQNLFERIMLGMVISKVFNSPFALYKSKGRPVVSNGTDLGYVFMGSVMTAFVFWMIGITADRYDKILFAARDGYLVKKMYEIVSAHIRCGSIPKACYFYTSRNAALSAGIADEEDLRYVSGVAFAGEPDEILKKRFYINDKEILDAEPGESAEHYCFRHKKTIMEKSAELRENYRKYIRNSGIKDSERIVFFDLVSSGSCQMGLQTIMDREIPGIYFIHVMESSRKKAGLKIESFIETGLLLELKSYMALNYEPIEGITAPHEPTILRFDSDGKPIFGENDRSAEEIAYVDEVQSGILDFCAEFANITENISVMVRSTFADKMYSLMRKKYSRVKNCRLSGMMFQDEFTGREFELKDMFD